MAAGCTDSGVVDLEGVIDQQPVAGLGLCNIGHHHCGECAIFGGQVKPN